VASGLGGRLHDQIQRIDKQKSPDAKPGLIDPKHNRPPGGANAEHTRERNNVCHPKILDLLHNRHATLSSML
jgi:hypothetical protein